MQLFREINVWREIGETHLVRYRCLHLLSEDRYAVKAADHYSSPLGIDRIRERDFYFVDSMFDGGLEFSTEDTHATLAAAISAFEAEFNEEL